MPAPPRVGLWLFPDADAGRLVDGIRAGEAAGVDELWLGDEGPARDPLTIMAAAARETTTIRLGVGVTNPYLRHPALTASTLATIHELSGGRTMLGLGPGGHLSLAPVGLDPKRPLTDCQAALTVIRGVLRGETVEGYSPPSHAITAPGLPVFIGSRGERFNRWASREADGVFLAGIAPMMLTEAVGWARSARAIDVCTYVSVGLDDAEIDELRPRMIHAFSNGPDRVLAAAGIERAAAVDAAESLAAGDLEPATRLITDERLDLVIARGPAAATKWLVHLARTESPTSVGLALLGGDPVASVERAASVLRAVKAELS